MFIIYYFKICLIFLVFLNLIKFLDFVWKLNKDVWKSSGVAANPGRNDKTVSRILRNSGVSQAAHNGELETLYMAILRHGCCLR